jgi:uncharacterized protein involved in exopolysaccharide biosynthesis
MTETLKQAEQQHTSMTADRANGRRRRRILSLAAVALAVVAVFAGAAVGYSLLQPRVYGAQVDFIVTPRAEFSDAAADRALLTQVMIVTSDPVLQPVAERAKIPLADLRGQVSADMVGRSTVLRLVVSDRDEARAVELARLITDEFLQWGTAGSTPAGGPGEDGSGAAEPPPTRTAVLAPATPLGGPLQPRPVRALAAGTLLGLLAAAVVLLILVRPRLRSGQSPRWE